MLRIIIALLLSLPFLATASSVMFTTNLEQGVKHPEVKLLQSYLNTNGFIVATSGPGAKGQETTYFGSATARALKNFQEAHSAEILSPNGLTKGTGLFYPSTRAFLNNMPGGSMEAIATPATTSGGRGSLAPAASSLIASSAGATSEPTSITVVASVSGYVVNAHGTVHTQSAMDTSWTVSINWGDGSAVSTTMPVAGLTKKDGTWASAHSYTALGAHTIVVSLIKSGVTQALNSTVVTITSPITNPVPTLTTISPATKVAGSAAFLLTLNGTNFIPSSVVKWNGLNRTTHYVSATQLTADILATDVLTAGASSVTVFTPIPGGGTSAAQTFTVTAPVITNPLPILTAFAPSTKVAGDAAFTLTLSGNNFIPTSRVYWGGTSRTTHYISATQLTADILAADIAVAGTSTIAVFNPLPGGGTSAVPIFTVTAPVVTTTYTTLTGNPSAFDGGATAGCTPHLSNDWIDTLDWGYRFLAPTDCAIVKITTPTFSWRQLAGDRDLTVPWNFTLRNAAGVTIFTATSSSPRLLLADNPLAPGIYSWQVNYKNTAGVIQTSVWRTFSIASDAVAFKLPSGKTYAAMAAAKASPRMLPTGSSFASIVASANAGELKNPYSSFLWLALNKFLPLAIPPAPAMKTPADFPAYIDYTTWQLSNARLASDEHLAIDYLAYAGKFTGDPKYDTAALAHIMALTTWSSSGPTSETNNDQANREVYLALAEGLDVLGGKMTTADRATVIAALRDRVGQTVNRMVNLDNQPNDSHLIECTLAAVQTLTLSVGVENFPEAQEWLAKSWETWLTIAPVWGGADGSWGNSGAYGWFRMLRLADTMAEARLVTGVDLAQWSVFGKFGDTQIAQYAPLYGVNGVTLRGSFGDGVEDTYFYPTYANTTYRLFAKLTGKPSDEWYWRVGTPTTIMSNGIPAINFMMLGLGLPAVTPAAPTNNSYAFADSGIAALHTSTADPLRTSVFFRSSRLGSLNHSHADNNAFTFVSKGKEILISGGYYPYYNSPHHAMDGRATRYKNALTFDGGIGQAEPTSAPTAPGAPLFSADTRGQLINYFDNGIWATVTGDATLAYRGYNAASSTWKLTAWTPLLTEADRTVVFNRVEKVAIIYDYATSVIPRQWELNYHTMLNSPFIVSGGTIEIDNAPGKACIDHYGLPGSFTQTTAFDVAPENGLPNQNHGRYTATTKSTVLTAITVIREDCRTLPVGVTFSGSSASVSLNGATPIILNKKTVQVPAI